MKLKNQLVNKELSIELDKLGAKEESLYWHKIPNKKCRNGAVDEIVQFPIKSKWFDFYRAYTVAELGNILGEATDIMFIGAYLKIMRLKEFDIEHSYSLVAHNLMTQPDISAQMLIYLLKNNFIKL